MLIEGAIMPDYAYTKNCYYYAQNYARILCQTLVGCTAHISALTAPMLPLPMWSQLSK